MVVPFSNRAAVARLPELALAKGPATVKEVIDDFANQCEPFNSVLECVQLVRGRTLRIHFPNVDVREDVTSGGLTFRGHPLTFSVPSTFKWVSVLDLPYGTPDGELSPVLGKYGQIATIRSEVYKNLYTGTKLVKMTVKSPIPSPVTIAGHVCTVFYRGQIRSCFRCGVSGHEAKKCPRANATLSAPTVPTITTSVVPPTNPSVTSMSTTPPSSPRTFASVLTGQVVPTTIGTQSSQPISPFLKEVLLLPLGPVDVTALANPETEVPSQKSNCAVGGRARSRNKEPPTPTTTEEFRDRSPLREDTNVSDSSSDSSGKSPTPNASVTDPPPVVPEVLPPLPTSTLDRRPLSVRYQEYCSTAPEYSQEEAEGLIESLLEAENQLASSTHLENRTTMEFQQLFDHLKLDHSIAVSACRAANPNDPQSAAIYATWQKAEAALTTFEVDYPEIVKEAEELYGDIDPEPPLTDVPSNSPAETTTSSQAVFSASPDIPNGQPVRPHTENLSSTDNPSPPILPEQMETDRTESSTDAGSLKTSRRSRHKSRSTNNELASCVRRRTAPALPGVRKPNPSTPHPPDSPYTPLVTDSGYLVTDPPRGTPPTRPKRPDTGAVGAVSPSLSSDSHP